MKYLTTPPNPSPAWKAGLACALTVMGLALVPASAATRTSHGLQVLYDFASPNGDLVLDRSGVGKPLNLHIENPGAVRRSQGSLEVHGKTLIRSEQPARELIDAIRKSGEITLEAWVRPSRTDQGGPARIVTLSKNPVQRNITLGHDQDHYEVRLRTTRTSANGLPELRSPSTSLKTELTHVVYTRDRSGRARIYLNGDRGGDRVVEGDTSNWDRSMHLALANELSKDRPWQGSYHLVAIYNRNLSPGEIRQNFQAGPRAGSAAAPVAEIKPDADKPSPSARTTSGLQVLYDFGASDGGVVRDQAGVGRPVDLRMEHPQAVARSGNALMVRGKTLIQSEAPPSRLIEAIRRSGELTLEAWITPGRTDQSGPARILTLSQDSGERNFTLGQDGDRFDVRLRTTQTSGNGIPSLNTPGQSVTTELTHVVYTRHRSGQARMFLNGEQVAQREVDGDLSNWNSSYRLALANELSGGRPWQGSYHVVAIYNRDLSPQEIREHYRAGPRPANDSARLARHQPSPSERLFNQHVAPLLSKHCLECHDAPTQKGGLDLSRQETALAGSKSGKVLVPGNPAESYLLEVVESDEMPKKRPPLSKEEKQQLRAWIEGGADWPVEVIDPAVYAHAGTAGQEWVRRLTLPEYVETVRSVVGVDIAEEARELLPRDLRADGFRNTAYNLNVDLKHVEAYARLAEVIVERMDVLDFARQYTKSQRLTDDNMRQLVDEMGRWVLRGPLEEREIVTFRGISTTVASAGGSFEEAVRYTLQAMLQSPRFMYRIENQRGDGSRWPVGGYELASRLSYMIWGGPPDKELYRLAESGDLYDREIVKRQVERMLEDPRAIRQSERFAEEWLNLGHLKNLRPNEEKFPEWEPELAADMRRETLAFFRQIVWEEKRPLSDLLNAQFTFLTPRLARHYGLEPGSEEGMARVDLRSVPARGGLLTQGSVLTVGGDEASMVTRGLFVLHDLLRGVINAPPPCVDTTPTPSKPGLTQRMVAEQRVADRNCGICHGKFEPLAFGLEKFDGLGAYHEKDEYGNALREDGEILFPGDAEAVPFETSSELMDLLAQSERVDQTLTWKLTQFAIGRPLTAEDAPLVDRLHERAQKEGGTYQSLIMAIALSDLIQTTRTENEL